MQGRSWPHSESFKKCRFCYAKIQRDPSLRNTSRAKNKAFDSADPSETVGEPFH